MSDFDPAKELRKHRSLLLACEAIGWLHMLGKAKADFLCHHGGQPNNYNYEKWFEHETPPFPWSDLLKWAKDKFPSIPVGSSKLPWPSSFEKFIIELNKEKGDPGFLGLLQAGHAMASGIEKNVPKETSKYLGQDVTHMWLSSVFGHPVRNLLVDPPEVLTDQGWQKLVEEVRRILEELKQLGKKHSGDVDAWHSWRVRAIGRGSFLRRAFMSTLAETRVPNNDVTLWDQSYVAAALFKSAVAGAILEGSDFPWDEPGIKQKVRWRLLTVGIGTDHYEARAIKIGDWKGSLAAIEEFFERVSKLVEVDLAIGSLLYRDTEVAIFSFPGEREGSQVDLKVQDWKRWLQAQIDEIAKDLSLETPPYCHISNSSRSLILLAQEGRKARDEMSVPLHRSWEIPQPDEKNADIGHVCPVCMVRLNGDPLNKQRPCSVCSKRRHGRLDAWLEGKLGNETIWMDEVADSNDRVALLTFSLDIEPWLEGERIDSLRAQSIPEWLKRQHFKQLKPEIKVDDPYSTFVIYSKDKLQKKFNQGDQVFRSLNPGYGKSGSWESFYNALVEDRANGPKWAPKNYDQNARWLVHQLFRKLASPGRIYRFWRQAEEFFAQRLLEFREIASRHPNRWRVRRLELVPDKNNYQWKDRETYTARWRNAPLELLYLREQGVFLTICNLARLLHPEESADSLVNEEFTLRDDKGNQTLLKVKQVKEPKGSLGAYEPVITLELSPLRFRIIVPLEAASELVERTIAAWEEEFGRVWDRLPLRVGVVAFTRLTPFQAVIEAVRLMEKDLKQTSEVQEVWRVAQVDAPDGVVALRLVRKDGEQEIRTIPIRLPDGREDVFYPYAAVEDDQVRFPRDFQHPEGQVYRHFRDLQVGDGIRVYPARIATLFLESTGARFDPLSIRYLSDWKQMQEIWRLLRRVVPSSTSLHGTWSELAARRQDWQGIDGRWQHGGEETWLDLVRALLAVHWGVRGVALESFVEAAKRGLLDWALEWHAQVLKESI